jgi:hypothetical protein
MDTSTPISTYTIYVYIHTTTICPESHVEHTTISVWDATVPRLGGTPNICIQQIGTSSTRPIERHSIRSLGTSPTRLPDYSAAKANQSGRGHILTAIERTTKKDIIKIGTTDVVIQENNEGVMIFGESANTNKKEEDTTIIKIADPKHSMPRWRPSGLTRSQKRKLQRLRAKENQEKEAEKIFNDTHPQYPPPQKKWRPKVVEEKQTTIKMPTGMADSPAENAGPSAQSTDRPTPESRPSAPHQDASNNVPTPMEEDDLLGEDLVDYEASPEHPGMDINVITFSADCNIIGDAEPVVAQFDFGPKEVAFTKPKESMNHLKPLFMRGHIDGIPIAKMFVDGGGCKSNALFIVQKIR